MVESVFVVYFRVKVFVCWTARAEDVKVEKKKLDTEEARKK